MNKDTSSEENKNMNAFSNFFKILNSLSVESCLTYHTPRYFRCQWSGIWEFHTESDIDSSWNGGYCSWARRK